MASVEQNITGPMSSSETIEGSSLWDLLMADWNQTGASLSEDETMISAAPNEEEPTPPQEPSQASSYSRAATEEVSTGALETDVFPSEKPYTEEDVKQNIKNENRRKIDELDDALRSDPGYWQLKEDEAVQLVVEAMPEEAKDDEDAWNQISEISYKYRRDRGIPAFSIDEVQTIAEEMAKEGQIEERVPITSGEANEEKTRKVDEYAEKIRTEIRNRLGNEKYLYDKEVDFAIEDYKKAVKREALGMEEQGGKASYGSNILAGAAEEVGIISDFFGGEDQGWNEWAQSFTDPDKDRNTFAQFQKGLGQGITQLGVVGAASIIPGGQIPAIAAIFGSNVWTEAKDIYNETYRATGDKEKALEAALADAPWAAVANSIDALVTLKILKPIIDGIPVTKLKEAAKRWLLKEAIKVPTNVGKTVAQRALGTGKVAIESALGEFVSGATSAVGQTVARDIAGTETRTGKEIVKEVAKQGAMEGGVGLVLGGTVRGGIEVGGAVLERRAAKKALGIFEEKEKTEAEQFERRYGMKPEDVKPTEEKPVKKVDDENKYSNLLKERGEQRRKREKLFEERKKLQNEINNSIDLEKQFKREQERTRQEGRVPSPFDEILDSRRKQKAQIVTERRLQRIKEIDEEIISLRQVTQKTEEQIEAFKLVYDPVTKKYVWQRPPTEEEAGEPAVPTEPPQPVEEIEAGLKKEAVKPEASTETPTEEQPERVLEEPSIPVFTENEEALALEKREPAAIQSHIVVEEPTPEEKKAGAPIKGKMTLITGKTLEFELTEQPIDTLEAQKDILNMKDDPTEGLDPERTALYKEHGVTVDPKNAPESIEVVRGSPIVVMEKKNGKVEVATGRNRRWWAIANKVKTLLAWKAKESENFTIEDAQDLDAELNIADGNGTTKDYVNFFSRPRIREKVTFEAAKKKGLFLNVRAKRGFLIGSLGSPQLITDYKNRVITEAAAADIANAAPNEASIQQFALEEYVKNKDTVPEPTRHKNAVNVANAYMEGSDIRGRATEQGDIFSQIKQTEADRARIAEEARVATEFQQEAERTKEEAAEALRKYKTGTQELSEGARALLEKGNIPIKEKEEISEEEAARRESFLRKELSDAATEEKKWKNWRQYPELKEKVRAAMGEKAPPLPTGVKAGTSMASMAAPQAGRARRGRYFTEEELREEGTKTPPTTKKTPYLPRREEEPDVSEEEAGPKLAEERQGIKEPIHKFSSPALLKLAKAILGENPQIFKTIIRGLSGELRIKGTTGRILLHQKLAKRPEEFLRAFAHEIGHAIGEIAKVAGRGSNILGKLVPLANFRKKLFGDTEVVKRLLPVKSMDVEEGGRKVKYTIAVSHGRIYAFKRIKNKKGKWEMAKGRQELPDAILDKYAKGLSKKEARLFEAVRNWDPRRGVRPVTETYSVDKATGAVLADPQLRHEAWELSYKWRRMPNFEGQAISEEQLQFILYRQHPQELYADLVSAILNDPFWVKKNFPNLYRAFQNSVFAKPDVQQSLNYLNELLGKPEEFTELLATEAGQQARRLRDVVQMEAERKQISALGRIIEEVKNGGIQKILRDLPRFFMESMLPIEKAVQAEIDYLEAKLKRRIEQIKQEQISPQEQEAKIARLQQEAQELREEIYRNEDIVNAYRSFPVAQFFYLTDIQGKVEDRLRALNISPEDWHTYKVARRIVEETNPVLDWIQKNPERAKEAVEWILDNAEGVGINIDANEHRYILDLEGQELADAIVDLDAALTIAGGNKRKNSALRNLVRAAKRVPIENLRKLLLEDFDVRRYLLNPNGWDKVEAQKQIDRLKKTYAHRFDLMEEVNKEFGDRNWEVIKEMNEAGLLSPEKFEHLRLNKYNYANFTVLSHFVENPHFDSVIRKQLGTFEEIGDTFYSTTAKTMLMLGHAVRQRGVNAAIRFAERQSQILGTNSVREVTDPRGRRYTKPDLLYRKYRDLRSAQRDRPGDEEAGKSYLIEMRQGTPHLWEIDDNQAMQDIFNRRVPDNLAFRVMQEVQSLQKALYTVLSPPFVYLTDPRRNVLREAVFASSIFPKMTFLMWHLSPSLRKKSKIAQRIAKDVYRFAQGEISALPDDMPMREEVIEMLKIGRLGFPLGNPRVLMESRTAGEGAINLSNLTNPNSISDILLAFQSSEKRASFVAAAQEISSQVIGYIPLVGTTTEALMDSMARRAQIEELRTKLTGYQIEKEKSGGDYALASRRAELMYGAPRPRGGGVYNAHMEAGFIFWRVGAYTPRVLKKLATEQPAVFMHMIGRRMFDYMWKFPLLSGAMSAALLTAAGLFGERKEEEAKKLKEKFDLFSSMLSRWERANMGHFPIAFWNVKTNEHRWFFDSSVEAKDVSGPDWQALAVRNPLDPDFRTISNILYTLYEFASGSPRSKHIASQLIDDVIQDFPDTAPILSTAGDLLSLIRSRNPVDDFFQSEIIPKDVWEGGDTADILYEYAKHAASKHFPLIPKPYKKAGDSKLAQAFKYPGASAIFKLTRSGISETSQAEEAGENTAKAKRRYSYPSEIRNMKKRHGILQNIGEDKRKEEGTQDEYLNLNNWHYSVYEVYDAEIEGAMELKDEAREQRLREQFSKDTKAGAADWARSRSWAKDRRKELGVK